jgi:hypothetical protein
MAKHSKRRLIATANLHPARLHNPCNAKHAQTQLQQAHQAAERASARQKAANAAWGGVCGGMVKQCKQDLRSELDRERAHVVQLQDKAVLLEAEAAESQLHAQQYAQELEKQLAAAKRKLKSRLMVPKKLLPLLKIFKQAPCSVPTFRRCALQENYGKRNTKGQLLHSPTSNTGGSNSC